MSNWAAFKGYNNGKAVVLSAVDQANLQVFGVHYYPTEALAEANPNSVASLPNPAAAAMIPLVNAAIDDYNNARDISPTQAKNPSNPLSSAQAGANTAKNAAGSLGNWTISGVSGTNLTIRAAKIIIGGALLIIGLAHITGSDHVVMQAARKVPLPI
jgi:hypothetical protein